MKIVGTASRIIGIGAFLFFPFGVALANSPKYLNIFPENAGVRMSVPENFRCVHGATIRIDVLSTAVFASQPADQVASKASLANFDATGFANLALGPLNDASGNFRCNLHSINRKIQSYFNNTLVGSIDINASNGRVNVELDKTNTIQTYSAEEAERDNHFNRIWTISRIISERDTSQRQILNNRLQKILHTLRAEKDRSIETADANNNLRRLSAEDFRASTGSWILAAEKFGHPALQFGVAQRIYHNIGIGKAILERREHDLELARNMFRLYRLSASQDYLYAVQQLNELRELGITVDHKGIATQSEEPNEIEIQKAINSKFLSGCSFSEMFTMSTGAAQALNQVAREGDWCVARQPILRTQMRFRISAPSEVSCQKTSSGNWDCRYMASFRCFAIVPNFSGASNDETVCPPPMNFQFPFRTEYRRNRGVGLEFVRTLN